MDTFTIHGVRGSYPVAGARYNRYGGSTSCFSLETPEGLFIVDAGTGIAALGEALHQRASLPPITILLTHVHLDHLIGIPSLKPLFRKEARVTFMGDAASSPGWRATLQTVIGRPLWPINLSEFGATIQFEELPDGPLRRYGVTITRCPIWHPQGGLSYRLQTPERAIVIGTDREHGHPQLDARFLEFCRGADVLLHDAQFTLEEFPSRKGWGHSTAQESARVAAAAQVGRLILVSHDPSHPDDQLDRIVEQAKQVFPNTVGGCEQMVL